MIDVHDRFDAWLAAADAAELPRDVALHASGCDRCLGRAAAIDGLLRLDIGAAAPPPVLDATRAGSIKTGLIAAGGMGAWVPTLGVLALVTAVGLANLGLFRTGPTAAEISPAPINEGVLGGAAGPSGTAVASASESESATPVSTETEPGASSAPPIVTPPQTTAPTPDPTRQPTAAPSEAPDPTRIPVPTRNQSPTPDPTPSPTIPPPPTPTPTAEPTPEPTPTASPTPTPPECEPLTTCPPP